MKIKTVLTAAAVAILFVGCAPTTQTESVSYRFKDDPKLHTFAVRGIPGLMTYTNVLLIDGVPQDTVPNVSLIVPEQSSLSNWNGRSVEVTSIFHYYVIYSYAEIRLFIDNERVAVWK